MIEVQHVDGRMYYVWLDPRLIDAIGWGNPETLINAALVSAFGAAYPDLFTHVQKDGPS